MNLSSLSPLTPFVKGKKKESAGPKDPLVSCRNYDKNDIVGPKDEICKNVMTKMRLWQYYYFFKKIHSKAQTVC